MSSPFVLLSIFFLLSFLPFYIYFSLLYECFACMYVVCLHNMYVPGALKGQKRVLDPPELGLWVTVNHYWVLRTRVLHKSK